MFDKLSQTKNEEKLPNVEATHKIVGHILSWFPLFSQIVFIFHMLPMKIAVAVAYNHGIDVHLLFSFSFQLKIKRYLVYFPFCLYIGRWSCGGYGRLQKPSQQKAVKCNIVFICSNWYGRYECASV